MSVHIRRGDLKQENGTMLGMSYYEEVWTRLSLALLKMPVEAKSCVLDRLCVGLEGRICLLFSQMISKTCGNNPCSGGDCFPCLQHVNAAHLQSNPNDAVVHRRELPHVIFVQIGIDFLEFRIMSMCDDHIIANSTFRSLAPDWGPGQCSSLDRATFDSDSGKPAVRSYWAAFLHARPAWRRPLPKAKRRKRRQPQARGTDVHIRSWRGTRVICPEVWGRGDTAESRFSVDELYPPQWHRVPNNLVSE